MFTDVGVYHVCFISFLLTVTGKNNHHVFLSRRGPVSSASSWPFQYISASINNEAAAALYDAYRRSGTWCRTADTMYRVSDT